MKEKPEPERKGWVPVTECHPPVDEPLLVYHRVDRYPSGEVHSWDALLVAKYDRTSHWLVESDAGYWVRFSKSELVTHWMYLPEPPGSLRSP